LQGETLECALVETGYSHRVGDRYAFTNDGLQIVIARHGDPHRLDGKVLKIRAGWSAASVVRLACRRELRAGQDKIVGKETAAGIVGDLHSPPDRDVRQLAMRDQSADTRYEPSRTAYQFGECEELHRSHLCCSLSSIYVLKYTNVGITHVCEIRQVLLV